ncbi:MAG TPA: hypothetical protein VGP93_12730 [Polyangiaceae bacterium]|jgi:heme/copper-type cytochrome/quinol oxidase subunit 2|nr:hypothetical protein [Polyangiaceae bacterium]
MTSQGASAGYGYGGSGFPPGGPNEALKKEATTWLVIAALSFVVCNSCCLGLIGAVLCFLSMQAADQGNTVDAEAKLRWGKILTIAGIAFGVLLLVSVILYQFVWAAGTGPR